MSKEHNLLTLAEKTKLRTRNTTSKLTMNKEHNLLTLAERKKLNPELETSVESFP